jgi:flagellar biosynthetic protein FliR
MFAPLLQFVPVFVLVVFRLAGMMLYAPLFGSARVPKRVRVLLVLITAVGMTGSIKAPAALPQTPWDLALGIGGELLFGLAMGMVMSFVFIATQWAGEIIGQQMGFNLSEVFDPQFGAQGSLVGDLYFMLTTVVFLVIGGHRAMLMGVYQSFQYLPLLSLGIDHSLFHLLISLFSAATILAVRLAAPVLVTMLVVDLVLGLIGKTMPQMNVMAAALNVRSAIGIIVVVFGLTLTVDVMHKAVLESMRDIWAGWTTPHVSAVVPPG